MRGGPDMNLSMGGRSYAAGKSPPLAFFLSFLIPSLGQFYNGDSMKGVIMLVVWLLSWPLWLSGGLGFFTGAGVWIWAMIDAYRVASGKSPTWR
jgi:TM2 domain-containing membrane protein YozV